MIFPLCKWYFDINWHKFEKRWAEVFQIYPNAIHLNPLQFCPPMPLLGFPVFCLSSSIVLNRYFHTLVNSMTIWSVLKLPKIAWPSPFNGYDWNVNSVPPKRSSVCDACAIIGKSIDKHVVDTWKITSIVWKVITAHSFLGPGTCDNATVVIYQCFVFLYNKNECDVDVKFRLSQSKTEHQRPNSHWVLNKLLNRGFPFAQLFPFLREAFIKNLLGSTLLSSWTVFSVACVDILRIDHHVE